MGPDLYTVWLGIPQGTRPPDHYTLLGLPRPCRDAKRIEQAAYAQLDKLDKFALHPDTQKRQACQEIMNEVARARMVLMDAQSRRAYDQAQGFETNEGKEDSSPAMAAALRQVLPGDTQGQPPPSPPGGAVPGRSSAAAVAPAGRRKVLLGVAAALALIIMAAGAATIYFLTGPSRASHERPTATRQPPIAKDSIPPAPMGPAPPASPASPAPPTPPAPPAAKSTTAHASGVGAPTLKYTMVDLGTLGGPTTTATAINDAGQITGWSLTKETYRHPNSTQVSPMVHPYLWTLGGQDGPPANPQMRDLGTFGGTFGVGDHFDAQGRVIGRASLDVANQNVHRFLFDGTALKDQGSAAEQTVATNLGRVTVIATNARGQIVGRLGKHCCLVNGTTAIDLGTLGGNTCTATAINANAQIVGGADAVEGGGARISRAFLWTPGGRDGEPANPQMQDLGAPGGSQATGINDGGDVVGTFSQDTGTHAFLYHNGSLDRLEALVGNLPAASRLDTVVGINNKGQIAATALLGVNIHAVLLMPSNFVGSLAILPPRTSTPDNAGTRPATPLVANRSVAGWVTLFRSDNPAIWGTSQNAAPDFSLPLDQAPHDMRYLRLRRMDTNQGVIIPLAFADLATVEDKPGVGWRGIKETTPNAVRLGIMGEIDPPEIKEKGTIHLYYRHRHGRSGWGFGNRGFIDDVQGYCWAGKPIAPTAMEISVTAADPTPEELTELLKVDAPLSLANAAPLPKGPVSARASDTWTNHLPGNVLIDNAKLGWNAGHDAPAWIEIDLGEQSLIKNIVLTVSQSNPRRTMHEVWVSDRPIGDVRTAAQLVHTFDRNTKEGMILGWNFSDHVAGRYVQVHTTRSGGWVDWPRIRIHSVPASAPEGGADSSATTNNADASGNPPATAVGIEPPTIAPDVTTMPKVAALSLPITGVAQATLLARARALMVESDPAAGPVTSFYSRSLGMFDEFFPMSALSEQLPTARGMAYEWRFAQKHLVEIDRIDGTRRITREVWYDQRHFPAVVAEYDDKGVERALRLAEYDAQGLIRRVTSWRRDTLEEFFIFRFESSRPGILPDVFAFEGRDGSIRSAEYRRGDRLVTYDAFGDSEKLVVDNRDGRLSVVNYFTRFSQAPIYPPPTKGGAAKGVNPGASATEPAPTPAE